MCAICFYDLYSLYDMDFTHKAVLSCLDRELKTKAWMLSKFAILSEFVMLSEFVVLSEFVMLSEW